MRMVSFIRYLFLLSIVGLASCNRSKFNMEFDLSPEITENYNVTYYATDIEGGVTVQAVASVREGKCVLEGFTKKPLLLYISTRKSNYPLVAYAEKGKKIKFSGSDKDPLGWKVDGDKFNQQLSEWRIKNLEILLNNESDSVDNAVKEYVEENSDNPVATILMLNYYNRKNNEREYIKLMASLHGEAKNKEWLNILARSDQMYHSYSYPARLESIVMRSIKEGADTLKIDGKNPVILFLWQTGSNDYKEMVDSIKSLEKEYKDSVRLIADICVDIDSVAWRNAIRKDSLEENIKRLWAPSGLTDSGIIKLKVASLPYFIVFNKEGNQSYRGNDLSAALEEYRNLQSETDKVKN